jgi:predicted aminopeptidase
MRLLLDREPLTPELEARLSEGERLALEALRRARSFGEGIGLTPSTSHRHLVDRGDRSLLFVVTAAPSDRLEALTWWFPIVGRVSYRGYFDEGLARRFASSLQSGGLDVYVREAQLYSTLGWFDDPVPRKLLEAEPFEVAETVLHERVHETIFVRDDVPYNEGIAVFISREAVLELYAREPGTRARIESAFRDEERFASLLEELAAELGALYERALPRERILEERSRVFERYRTARFHAVAWETRRFERFPSAPLSNAYVVAQRAYLGELACFASERARYADLAGFVRAHRERPGRRVEPRGECALGRAQES